MTEPEFGGCWRMSIDTLKEEISKLNLDDRRELWNYFQELRRPPESLRMTEEEKAEVERLLNDKDPSNWLTMDQVQERLRKLDEDEGI